MEDKLRSQWPDQPVKPAADELRRIGIALRQLEWADTYLQAVDTLQLRDHHALMALHEVRTRLTDLELTLRRLAAR